ncbi:hypothetical protein DFJ73DRAFT_817514 [Zopfochytrium polystomum]|nr:hypothetical protein DFJ73DRAFT_817514 [Zopfochytrium polystomum]
MEDTFASEAATPGPPVLWAETSTTQLLSFSASRHQPAPNVPPNHRPLPQSQTGFGVGSPPGEAHGQSSDLEHLGSVLTIVGSIVPSSSGPISRPHEPSATTLRPTPTRPELFRTFHHNGPTSATGPPTIPLPAPPTYMPSSPPSAASHTTSSWHATESFARWELRPYLDPFTGEYHASDFIFEGRVAADGAPDMREATKRSHLVGEEDVFSWEDEEELEDEDEDVSDAEDGNLEGGGGSGRRERRWRRRRRDLFRYFNGRFGDEPESGGEIGGGDGGGVGSGDEEDGGDGRFHSTRDDHGDGLDETAEDAESAPLDARLNQQEDSPSIAPLAVSALHPLAGPTTPTTASNPVLARFRRSIGGFPNAEEEENYETAPNSPRPAPSPLFRRRSTLSLHTPLQTPFQFPTRNPGSAPSPLSPGPVTAVRLIEARRQSGGNAQALLLNPSSSLLQPSGIRSTLAIDGTADTVADESSSEIGVDETVEPSSFADLNASSLEFGSFEEVDASSNSADRDSLQDPLLEPLEATPSEEPDLTTNSLLGSLIAASTGSETPMFARSRVGSLVGASLRPPRRSSLLRQSVIVSPLNTPATPLSPPTHDTAEESSNSLSGSFASSLTTAPLTLASGIIEASSLGADPEALLSRRLRRRAQIEDQAVGRRARRDSAEGRSLTDWVMPQALRLGSDDTTTWYTPPAEAATLSGIDDHMPPRSSSLTLAPSTLGGIIQPLPYLPPIANPVIPRQTQATIVGDSEDESESAADDIFCLLDPQDESDDNSEVEEGVHDWEETSDESSDEEDVGDDVDFRLFGEDEQAATIFEWAKRTKIRRLLLARPRASQRAGTAAPKTKSPSLMALDEVSVLQWLKSRDLLDGDGVVCEDHQRESSHWRESSLGEADSDSHELLEESGEESVEFSSPSVPGGSDYLTVCRGLPHASTCRSSLGSRRFFPSGPARGLDIPGGGAELLRCGVDGDGNRAWTCEDVGSPAISVVEVIANESRFRRKDGIRRWKAGKQPERTEVLMVAVNYGETDDDEQCVER